MNKLKLNPSLKKGIGVIDKNLPKILTGIGVCGFVSTVVVAVKATPKAVEIVELEKARRQVRKIPATDIVKLCWKLYVPATILGSASVLCVLGGAAKGAKRTAALATAYKIAEESSASLKEAMVEKLDKEEVEDILSAAKQKKLDKITVPNENIIVNSYSDDILVFEEWSGRYFMSNYNKMEETKNKLNYSLHTEGYAALNVVYENLNLDTSKSGSELGWNLDRDGLIEFVYIPAIRPEDKRPCVCLGFSEPPKYDYAYWSRY